MQLSLASPDIVERIQVDLVEKTGIANSIFDRIKLEVGKVIDYTATERVMQTHPQFRKLGRNIQYSKESSELLRIAKIELIDFSKKVLSLYRPLMIWILTNPIFQLRRLYLSKMAIDARGRAFARAAKFSAAVRTKGSQFWTGLKNSFQKIFSKPQNVASLLKRSDQTAFDFHVDNLVKEHYYYQKHNSKKSVKEKLIYGWKLVIRDVSSEKSQRFFKREMDSRIFRIFAGRLIDALHNVLDKRFMTL